MNYMFAVHRAASWPQFAGTVVNGCFCNPLMQQNNFWVSWISRTVRVIRSDCNTNTRICYWIFIVWNPVVFLVLQRTDWLVLIVRGCQALGENKARLCSVCIPDSFAEIRAQLLVVFGSHGCVCTHWLLTSEHERCTEESLKWDSFDLAALYWAAAALEESSLTVLHGCWSSDALMNR